jgi:prepilin-type N-terminal cleavage/methylation domain-containing protein
MKTKKLNNKGFSLVELICSVAILGIVIVPLLHSFVTSSNLTAKTIKQSESTLAAKNILEAVGALPISEFKGGDQSKKIVNLLSPNAGTGTDVSSTALSVLSEPDALDNFSVAIDNVPAGNSVFDAKVEFSRGEETSPSSDGLYLINSEKIRLAQYDSMDGVFCQPYDIGSNPDVLVEDEMNSQAIIAGYSKEDLIKRTREIRLDVEFDPNQEGTPGIPDSDRLHYAKITYKYRFYYQKTTPSFSMKDFPWERSYTIFPGGYAPKNEDNSLSVYLMIYPVFSDKYSSDQINISNNSEHQYKVTDPETGKQ